LAVAALLAVFAGGTSTARAEAPAGGAQTRFTLPHAARQLLVKTVTGTPQSVIETVLAPFGGTVLEFSGAPAELYVVELASDALLEAAVTLLEADPRFELAQPNFVYAELAPPNDARFAEQWAKRNTGANRPDTLGSTPGADMNMVAAWDVQRTAPGIVVAVIDDAVETTHLDLVGNLLAGKCFASPGSARPCTNGPDDPNPAGPNDFHGTLVTGAAAARGDNALGIAGAAWETGVLPIKVDLSSYAIVRAIDEAIAGGAAIVNMSFGGPVEDPAQAQALARSEAAGILVVAAAGNADASNDRASHYPSDAAQPNVLAVAATTPNDTVAAFSQWGSFGVDLAAPGELILTTAINNDFAVASGTSFAAPHVAGIAALVAAQTGAADYHALKARLLNAGVNGVTTLGPVVPGQSRLTVPGRVATGRIDAARALQTPSGGVLVMREARIDDTATGNANGRLDPGETALLEITIENLWSPELGVTGVLSTADAGLLLINDAGPVLFGAVAQNSTAQAQFSVTLANTVIGNEQIFVALDLESPAPADLPTRYFYLEVGSLQSGTPVTQEIQRWNWDEFQHFHLSVPAGATNLQIQTSGNGDIDLLVRAGQPPDYLITLGGGAFYYVDTDSQLSAGPGANESVSVATPLPGTYHVVVVNFDRVAKTYQLTATYDSTNASSLAFAAAAFAVSESAGTAVVTVNRSGSLGAAAVEYAVAQGSATPGGDYTNINGTLSWAAGESEPKTFAIPIVDDALPEALESFTVTLTNATGAPLGTPAVATVQITDDDGPSGAGSGGGGGGGSVGAPWLLVLALGLLVQRNGRRRATQVRGRFTCAS
jgi:subtilisin family serine protease